MIAPNRFALLILLCCTGGAIAADQDCAPQGGLAFVCGPQNAEDMVLVPGTRWIIASGMADGTGFFLIDAGTADWRPLPWQAGGASSFAPCPNPPSPATLNTHGLNVRAAGEGRARLYVVGHGGREAIEVFEVDARGAQPTLTWQGCVPMPEGLAANSVASLPDGGLLATVLFTPGKGFADSVVGKPTGAVYEWSPGAAGFTLVQGSELAANNGIEVSADGSEFYVAATGALNIVAFARANPTRTLRSTAPLPFAPDNVHMGPNGRLLTAGMKNDVPECGGPPGLHHSIEILAACPRGSYAIAIDPRTMQYEVLIDSPAIPQFSNATMVLDAGGKYWLGSFAGNRIAYRRAH